MLDMERVSKSAMVELRDLDIGDFFVYNNDLFFVVKINDESNEWVEWEIGYVDFTHGDVYNISDFKCPADGYVEKIENVSMTY